MIESHGLHVPWRDHAAPNDVTDVEHPAFAHVDHDAALIVAGSREPLAVVGLEEGVVVGVETGLGVLAPKLWPALGGFVVLFRDRDDRGDPDSSRLRLA